MSGRVLRFPVTEEMWLNELSDRDLAGPMPCDCWHIAVYDFGHDSTCPLPREER